MSHFYHLLELDTGRYVTCKNLYLNNFLPNRIPFVLQSVITEDELYRALCSLDPDGHLNQSQHYKQIAGNLFIVFKNHYRIIHVDEDELFDWKYGYKEPPFDIIHNFSPLSEPADLKEVYETYEEVNMQQA